MKDWLDNQLGRILLAVAVLWTFASLYQNRAQALPQKLVDPPSPPVHVLLDKEKLAAVSTEVYFPSGPGSKYAEGGRFVFVPEKVVKIFQSVELEIPPMNVTRPPQILPEPGPSLEGAHKLPRFGDEFPPMVVTEKPGAVGTPAGIAPGVAPAFSGVGVTPAPKKTK